MVFSILLHQWHCAVQQQLEFCAAIDPVLRLAEENSCSAPQFLHLKNLNKSKNGDQQLKRQPKNFAPFHTSHCRLLTLSM